MSDLPELNVEAEISVEEIMKRIRAYIAQRRMQQELGDVLADDFGLRGSLSSEIYESLSSAVQHNAQLGQNVDLRASSYPIIGKLVNTLKRSLHQLVVFYVNKSVAAQAAVNSDILRTLGAIVAEMESVHEPDDQAVPRDLGPILATKRAAEPEDQ